MAGRSNMRPQTPGGEGELLRAGDLVDGRADGHRIRLNPGGGEYEALLLSANPHDLPRGWVRLKHERPGLSRPTINVVPPSVEVRILK